MAEHFHGLKVWVNGQLVYSDPRQQGALGNYVQFGRHRLNHQHPHAPLFELELRQGWNRILCKVSTATRGQSSDMRFCMWLMEREDAAYEEKNILWKVELPDSSTSTPILVGNKLFLTSEPDELLCIDKDTGKILWSASNSYYDATPQEERDANPAFAQTVEPLVQKLKVERDYGQRLALRREIQEALKEIDRRKYVPKVEGHMEGHFGVVGYSLPTPCSDGESVYVFFGTGVAACYDLDGNRKWITRLDVPILVYPCSPALVGDVFAVFIGHLRGLDKHTGKVIWEQQSVNQSSASLLPARLAGVDVIISQKGDVVRASDGHVLYANPDKISGDTGWNAPVVLGQTLYLPWYGAMVLNILDFSECSGEQWTPARRRIEGIAPSRLPDGKWLDRWAASSWLIHDGLGYVVDIYKTLYIVDLEQGKTLVRQELDFGGLMHYNALPVAASPTLIGRHIYILNNQGETIVMEPGREYKPVAKNHIATQLPRVWPIPPQETLSYAPPITDGKRMFLRGERYLYCIGAK